MKKVIGYIILFCVFLLLLIGICFLISIQEHLPFLKVFLFGLIVWFIVGIFFLLIDIAMKLIYS